MRWQIARRWLVLLPALIYLRTGYSAMVLEPDSYFSGIPLTIYRSAQSGNLASVQQLVNTNTGMLEAAGKQEMNLLALACMRGDTTAIATLMRAGANPDHVISGAGSPATFAIDRHAQTQSVAAIAGLISGGFSPDALLDGKPWMFYMVDHKHWTGLQFALKHGGHVNLQARWGQSLLGYAIERSELDEAGTLLDLGADVGVTIKSGDDALESLEFAITSARPATPAWNKMLTLRQRMLAQISEPALRTTPFTQKAEGRIQAATGH